LEFGTARGGASYCRLKAIEGKKKVKEAEDSYFFFCFCCPTRTFEASALADAALIWVAMLQLPSLQRTDGSGKARQYFVSLWLITLSQPSHFSAIDRQLPPMKPHPLLAIKAHSVPVLSVSHCI
jgi:hypothetical protein